MSLSNGDCQIDDAGFDILDLILQLSCGGHCISKGLTLFRSSAVGRSAELKTGKPKIAVKDWKSACFDSMQRSRGFLLAVLSRRSVWVFVPISHCRCEPHRESDDPVFGAPRGLIPLGCVLAIRDQPADLSEFSKSPRDESQSSEP